MESFVDAVESLGLNNSDIETAQEFLNHREYGLAFDTIITQMYEYEVEIDSEFYNYIEVIAKEVKLLKVEYVFMQELIRSSDTIPEPVKRKLAEVLSNLKTTE